MSEHDPEQIKRAVGRRVAELRQKLGLTQAGFAERMSDDPNARISPQYVGLIEQGRENLTIEGLVRLARALNVPIRKLFDAPRSMKAPSPGRPRTARAGAKR